MNDRFLPPVIHKLIDNHISTCLEPSCYLTTVVSLVNRKIIHRNNVIIHRYNAIMYRFSFKGLRQECFLLFGEHLSLYTAFEN